MFDVKQRLDPCAGWVCRMAATTWVAVAGRDVLLLFQSCLDAENNLGCLRSRHVLFVDHHSRSILLIGMEITIIAGTSC